MRPETIDAIRQRIERTQPQREQTRVMLAQGHAELAERDPTRRIAFAAKAAKSLGLPEAIHGTNDFQPACFLADGARTRRAVARVLVQAETETRSGSGFLISPDLFITNQHVIKDAVEAKDARLIFDDEVDHLGQPVARTVFALAPERVALFSDEKDLDFALVAVGERVEGSATTGDLGYIPLSNTPDRHRKGMNVNIIQHPYGAPKKIAVRNNVLTEMDDSHLFYETDTDEGSSGAPVHNDQWDVVALHHYGHAAGDDGARDGENGPHPDSPTVNEGIRISAIFEDLNARLPRLDAVTQELVHRALTLWTESAPKTKTLERRPPSPQDDGKAVIEAATPHETEHAMTTTPASAATLTIPLEVSIHVAGAAAAAPNHADAAVVSPPAKRLHDKPESSRLDTDYTDRSAFDADFVPDITIDLARIVKPLAKKIAALKSGQRKDGRLDYENFSVVMHKDHRLAMITATNIDGPSYIAIDRKTGKPAATQPEAETWYRDTRIDEGLTITNDFYSEWSHLFDRGHLTRRDDPTWGANAARANTDTFHFTNCSPQHWRFNESVQYWQGVERYVLERGLFVSGKRARLSVLQGPLFDDVNDLWADDVQIPSAFWKIVVWNGSSGLKAVAMMVDQSSLLAIERKGGSPPPSTDTPVQVAQYQTTIATLAKKTKLDFSAIEPYDAAGTTPPTVGEAISLITKWEDIKL